MTLILFSLLQDAPPAVDLSAWKLTLPVAERGRPREIGQPDLPTFRLDPFFRLGADGVSFHAPVDGATTEGSSYPRCELRELEADGTTPAAWSTEEGVHAMTIRQAITRLPSRKPHVVAGQVHDAKDDVVMIRLEGRKLFVEGGGKNLGVLDPDYALGTFFTVRIAASGGRIRVYYEDLDTPKVDIARRAVGCYFKAGVYAQSNPSKGEPAGEFGEVVVRELAVTHAP
jgi:poly(beta-D-mannuronate) lyase